MTTKKTKKFNFETSLKKLESIVNSMERGTLNLDESLKTFSEGILLTQQCQEALKAAEQKVEILAGEKLTDFIVNLEEEKEGKNSEVKIKDES